MSMSMKEVIPIANQLQELLVNIEGNTSASDSLYDLPQIAVIGNQSVGKSSVLEALMGISCLPRGTGMVTKCPLILQLKSSTREDIARSRAERNCAAPDQPMDCASRHIPSVPSSNEECRFFVEFSHLPGEFMMHEDSIRDEIVKRTSELCGGVESAVSSRAIIMKLTSLDVIDLTLIDLPGLIRVPASNQPSDIDEQIKKLVLQYVKSPKCIILAVSAANVDLANSDSLRIAREVDPQGYRTIGVLTKADLIDDPTAIVNVMEGRLYPLRRGYVPVKCRASSQSTLDILQSLKDETEFFRANLMLKEYRCGTEYLAKKLNECLFLSIKQFLPSLKVKIETAISEFETRLQQLGEPVDVHDPSSGALLLDVFTRYSKTIDDLLDGRATTLVMDELSNTDSAVELVGGARLHYIFHDWFATCVMRLDPLAGLSDKEIRTAIRNASGFSTSLFVPENAFEMLVKKQIQKLEQPACQCVYQARQEMLSLIEVPLKRIPEFQRFTVLQEKVRQIARQTVDDHLNKTSQTVTNFIQIELAFVNKSHPDFITGKKAISNYLIATAGGTNRQGDFSDPVTRPSSESAGPPQSEVSQQGAAVLLSSRPVPVTPTTGVSDASDPDTVSRNPNETQRMSLRQFNYRLRRLPVLPPILKGF
eukprot:Gregarina_sp_Poly_1__10361@NODE_739_length_6515_cov_119_200527_g388_i1_p2_GENE_NODE_739_length_6515_cov_119_200527_g388_i1NODE_739_length_6515_cov_119_200527_g388_i1_p2_ORF_typecomplete_len650_score102_09Dynamin_M/PF01031_20/6_5e60Dynamin_N/PF00350_23/2_5e39FeoB_N/PF02421_18/0_19FeoB_N/PF02421_18/0_00025MMR_HSR1/PF01926_23/5_7e06AIG1/PF04548_16/12AIG1/PF04548_16/0_03RsgA_GTPase/PF03193_16/3_6RsgA_GTPase/PF03193_16/0_75IIGP/PF05049_13/0_68IIGP/PF05049_13/2_3e02AAA_15/PF13175_6/0_31_NODE_739_lengt